MIDRSYLPFPSARFYQDRKMAKWMGFFLSEHSTALNQEKVIVFPNELSLEERSFYLQQLYLSGQPAIFYLEDRWLEGSVKILQESTLALYHQGQYQWIPLSSIHRIVRKENEDESSY